MTPIYLSDIQTGNIQRRSRFSSKQIWPWQESPPNFARGEESLWKAVLTQALLDATAKCNRADLYYYKVEAMRWLFSNSQDFQDVCIRAGYDPKLVRRHAKKAIDLPRAWEVQSGMSERFKRRSIKRRVKTIERRAARFENLQQGCLILHLFSGRAAL